MILVVAGVLLVTGCASAAPQGRYGLRDECNDTKGWYQWDKDRNPMPIEIKGMKSENGKMIVPLRRTLLRFAWNRSWVAPGVKRSAIICKEYGEVDLDRYHYLACRIVEKGSGVFIGINGFDTKLGYTTGLTVIDLNDYDEVKKGKRNVRLELDLHENSTTFILDELALLSELTEEEKKVLIPKGVVPRIENLKAKPYHALEALKARCGAPLVPLAGQEQAVYHDTATGGIVTRLTNSPRGDSFGEGGIWSADGACIFFDGIGRQGRPVYYVRDGHIDAAPAAGKTIWHPNDPNKLYLLIGGWREPKVQLWDRRTKEVTTLATLHPKKVGGYVEFHTTRLTGRVTVAYRETPYAFVVDPKKPEGERVTEFELSSTLKGFGFSPDEKYIRWGNCYTYEGRYRNLATGEEGITAGFFVGHASGGKTHTVGEFGRHLKLIAPNGLFTERRPGDKIRIWANYGGDVVTDYGRLTRDAEWIFTNGTRGDVANQHVTIPTKDPGSILRLTRYFTSYYDWGSATYSRPSPDYTKLIFVQDVLDNPDLYMVYTRRPDPPRNVRVQAGTLKWDKPKRSQEIAGYNVYARANLEVPWQRINDKPVTATELRLANLERALHIVAVSAVEHSGLEGLLSHGITAGINPLIMAFEPERMKLTPPARIVYDGRCSDFRYVRITPETPEEKTGHIVLDIPPLKLEPRLEFELFIRTRGKGTWEVAEQQASQNGPLGTFSDKVNVLARQAVDAADWTWLSMAKRIRPGTRLTFSSSDVDLSVDGIVVQPNGMPAPTGIDPRDATPPDAPKDLKAILLDDNGRVELQWDKSPAKDLWFFSVYAGEKADFTPGNETLIRSVKGTRITDSGVGRGKKVFYKVVAYDARMNASEPAVTSTSIPGKTFVQTIQAEDHLTGKLEKIDGGAVTYVAGKEKGDGYIQFQVDVPEDGWYRLWVDYTAYYRAIPVGIAVDGKQVGGYGSTLRVHPSTISRRSLNPKTARLFSDPVRLSLEKDLFELKKGTHTLRFLWRYESPLVDKFHLTNDGAWRPKAYDPLVRPKLKGRGL